MNALSRVCALIRDRWAARQWFVIVFVFSLILFSGRYEPTGYKEEIGFQISGYKASVVAFDPIRWGVIFNVVGPTRRYAVLGVSDKDIWIAGPSEFRDQTAFHSWRFR